VSISRVVNLACESDAFLQALIVGVKVLAAAVMETDLAWGGTDAGIRGVNERL
jgi:hypothetical protein